jgi:transcription antitermination protein NusB
MNSRTKARKRAIDTLYAADIRHISREEALRDAVRSTPQEQARAASWRYAQEIVQGVIAQAHDIDETIERYSEGWALTRMPTVDRAILRVGVWEILFALDVPDGVAISEAVEAASALSTADSAGFINGLLASVARDNPRTAEDVG